MRGDLVAEEEKAPTKRSLTGKGQIEKEN